MDVLIFQILDRVYAIDAETIVEVIDPVPVTPLPFVPAEVEGLINVAGQVVPQINGACRLGLARELAGESVVILLRAGEAVCAIRVSRVVAKLSIEKNVISESASDTTEPSHTVIAGEFPWHEQIVILLDPASFMFKKVPVSSEQDEEGLVATASEGDRPLEGGHDDDFSCVLFLCRQELFALRFSDVIEVVESSKSTPFPGAPPEMPGTLLLRGFPLPLIDMQALLFGEQAETAPYTMVVQLNGCLAGLQVERVVGIQRFALTTLRSMAEETSLLEGFVTTPDNRLVGVIRFSSLAAENNMAAWKPFLLAAESAEGDEQLDRTGRSLQYLMFHHGGEVMAVPLAAVERIEEYSAVTDTPGDNESAINGVIQVQGVIVPVTSLEQRMNLQVGQPTVYLIIRQDGNCVAVPVEKVDRVVDLFEKDIDPVHSGANNLLSGVGKYQGTLVSLLSVERLIPA